MAKPHGVIGRVQRFNLCRKGWDCVVGKAVAYRTGTAPVGERALYCAGWFHLDGRKPRVRGDILHPLPLREEHRSIRVKGCILHRREAR